MASYIEINDLGSFANINALWSAYPEGGHEGDYCTIGSVKYHWDKYDRMWVADPNFGPTPARKVDTFYSDVNMQNNLTVAGYIRAKGIKQPCLGLFASAAALSSKWPNPEVGMWALVGNSMSSTSPAAVYRCDTEGTWAATGGSAYIDGLEINVAKGITGWVPISSTSQLPTDPTPDQQGRGYLLGTMLYVYVGTGGDTLSGKYQSAQLKGATGETGPQGPSGVHEDDVTIADNLTTDDPLQVLSAKQGKKLKEYIFTSHSDALDGTRVQEKKINSSGAVVTGQAGYGFTTEIALTSSVKTVHIYGNCAGYDKAAYAFYNNGVLVEKGQSFSGNGNIDVDVTVDVPTGSTTLILSNNAGSDDSMFAAWVYETNNFDTIDDEIDIIQENIGSIEETLDSFETNIESQLYEYARKNRTKLGGDGSIIENGDAYGNIRYLSLTESVVKVHIWGDCTGYFRSGYAFFDDEDALLLKGASFQGDGSLTVNEYVDVPSGAAYLILCSNNGIAPTMFAAAVDDVSDGEKASQYLDDYTAYKSNTLAEQTALRLASKAKAEGRMIFEDDFDGYKLNDNIWNVDEGQFLNRTTYVNAKENVWVENSILHISTTLRNRYGKRAMGQVTTKGKYDFAGSVRVEGKFRMPTIGCFWPAFWTWGTDTYAVSRGAGPYAELDIFELFGTTQDSTNGRVAANLWTGDAVGDGTTSGLTQDSEALFTNDGGWHIYRADIYQDKVIVAVDGVVRAVYTLTDEKRQYVYTMRQYVMMSVQYWDRNTPTEALDGATLECDWVRVYALDDTDIMPTSIAVDSTLSMSVGDKVRLVPTFTGGIDRTTTYDIVDESVIGHGEIVNSELVAKAAGTTDVYVITKNRKTAKCTITVS